MFVIIVLGGRGPGDATPKITRTIDPDTGDEIISVEGKDPEYDPDQGPDILGGANLIDETVMTDSQYGTITDVVIDYVTEKIGKDVTVIKFLPKTLKATASKPDGTPYRYKVSIKTENPTVTLDATIDLVGLEYVQVIINSPTIGKFDSGIQPYEEEDHGQEENFDGGNQ